MIKKVGNTEAKANQQPPFYVWEIDFRYPKGRRLSAKKDKKDTYWEPYNKASNKDKDKAKSQNSSSASQPQTQAPKKDNLGRWKSHLATGVNTTKVAKKDKDKVSKDLSYVKCYTCKQKDHYANKCLKKAKN